MVDSTTLNFLSKYHVSCSLVNESGFCCVRTWKLAVQFQLKISIYDVLILRGEVDLRKLTLLILYHI